MAVGARPVTLRSHQLNLLRAKLRLQGGLPAPASDSEDTMRFATLTGVRPMIEKISDGEVNEAYERMNSGHAAIPRRDYDVILRTVPIGRRGLLQSELNRNQQMHRDGFSVQSRLAYFHWRSASAPLDRALPVRKQPS